MRNWSGGMGVMGVYGSVGAMECWFSIPKGCQPLAGEMSDIPGKTRRMENDPGRGRSRLKDVCQVQGRHPFGMRRFFGGSIPVVSSQAPRPPANGWQASGLGSGTRSEHCRRMAGIGDHPEGMPAISRGLSEERATPPDSKQKKITRPRQGS